MTRAVALLVALFIGCTPSMPAAVAPSRPELIALERAANVLVHARFEARVGNEVIDTADAFCSGVVLGPHTVATAGHCVDFPAMGPGVSVSVVLGVARPDDLTDVHNSVIIESTASVARVNTDSDVAVLRVSGAVLNGAVALGYEPPAGAHVSSVTNSHMLINTYAEGFVGGLRMRDLQEDGVKSAYVQTSVPITHGASGGGLFDDSGHLVGICSHTDGTYTYWASVESLRALLAH